ncbi:Afadin ALL1-fused gene from chromosome 6 protein [Triplophysa tibetana]|uniref:Afadin ALL1-fused gene from chromosome 6 protein n=1 Tax=Triplophysa tibetana TaxID=1572043 RepID=A0A5A9NEB9_9TELE|nr:Afadin ALL1-fused gene from chromosome 6 protein [Triplophysa tibetana]
MSGSREEERRKLADIINHWNANRLDLFEISQPTEYDNTGMRVQPLTKDLLLSWDNERRGGTVSFSLSLKVLR